MAPRALLVAPLLLAAAAVTTTVVVRGHGEQNIRYASARAMATKVGCTSSFQPKAAARPLTGAGTCVVDGTPVEFALAPTADDLMTWQAGVRQTAGVEPGVVGDGWIAVVHTGGGKLLPPVVNQVSGRLTTP